MMINTKQVIMFKRLPYPLNSFYLENKYINVRSIYQQSSPPIP